MQKQTAEHHFRQPLPKGLTGEVEVVTPFIEQGESLRALKEATSGIASAAVDSVVEHSSEATVPDIEKLDEETREKIKRVESRWRCSGASLSRPSAGTLWRLKGDKRYQAAEAMVPNIRQIAEVDERFRPGSDIFDEREYKKAVQRLLRYSRYNNPENIIEEMELIDQHHQYMPNLMGELRQEIRKKLNVARLYRGLMDNQEASLDKRRLNQHKCLYILLSVIGAKQRKAFAAEDSFIPSSVYKDYAEEIYDEITHMILNGPASVNTWNQSLVFDEYVRLAAEKGFPPQHWMSDAEHRSDFPDSLRRIIAECDPNELDETAIGCIIDDTEERGYTLELVGDINYKERVRRLTDFYEDRLPEVNTSMFTVSDMVYQSEYRERAGADERGGIFKQYIKTIRTLGQERAAEIQRRCGINRFSSWNPKVLEGTLAMLKTRKTESGGLATLILRGGDGDYNGYLEDLCLIESGDVFAAEVFDANSLLCLTERLESSGVADMIDRVMVNGHGDEGGVVLSSDLVVAPKVKNWRKVLAGVMGRNVKTILLNSCHPIVRKKGVEPLSVGEEPQKREGNAVAISRAFPDVEVVSGQDGWVVTGNQFGRSFSLDTVHEQGDEYYMTNSLVVTKNGLTQKYGESAKIVSVREEK